MDEAPNFASLFVDNEAGELLYFLIIVGLTLASLLVAIDQRTRSQHEREATRYMWTLTGVVIAWGVLTFGNLFNLLTGSADADIIIPPLERAITATVILLLTWVFLTAESPGSNHKINSSVLFLMLLMAAAFVFTVSSWRDVAATEDFNQHNLGLLWTVIPIGIVLMGSLLLLFQYNFAADIPLKLLFFAVILMGHIYTLFEMGNSNLSGNEAGSIRIAMLAALSLLPVLLYRMVIDRFREAVNEISGMVQTIPPQEIIPQAPVISALPPVMSPGTAAQIEAMSLLKIAGMMLESSSPREIPAQIAKAVAITLKADIVAVVAIDDPNWADPIAAYDYIHEVPVPGLALNLDNQPTLTSAIELNLQCVLLPTRNSDELKDLFHRLDVQDPQPIGPAYLQPLSRNRQVVGMLVLAMPYTTRRLEDSERNLLEAIGPIAARLLVISREAAKNVEIDDMKAGEAPAVSPERDGAVRAEMQEKLEAAQKHVDTLYGQIGELKSQLEDERGKLSKLAASSNTDMSITQQINVLSDERQNLKTEREELVLALQEARTILATATADSDEAVYREMLDGTSRERENLMAEKQRLERELAELRGAAPQDHGRLQDVINTLMAEKDRLADEHQQLKSEIEDAQSQLTDLGIEGGLLGFAKLLAHLTEERNRFLAESKRALAERDFLLRERQKLEDDRQQESVRTQQIQTLQTELQRLAADREVVMRQRDALKAERDSLNTQREDWVETRVNLTQQVEALRRNLEETQQALTRTRSSVQTLTDTQEIALAARNPDEEIRALHKRVQDVEEHRSDMEFDLIRTRNYVSQLEESIESLQEIINEAERVPTTEEETETIVGLAQELRTPLTSIMGYAELMLGESMGILGETQRQFIMRIQVNTAHLIQLIENLIRVLAIDYGTLVLAPHQVDVEDLIDDAITSSSAQYREKGLTLHLEIMPELPEIMGDRDALLQILTRLLTNAYLAAPADSAVRVVAEHNPQYQLDDAIEDVVYFEITDQGGGVPESEHERVFARHYRAENPLIQGLGDTGAGLSIASALTLAHGGKIWLETEPGISTTFKVVIPTDHVFGEQDILRGNVYRLIETLESNDQ